MQGEERADSVPTAFCTSSFLRAPVLGVLPWAVGSALHGAAGSPVGTSTHGLLSGSGWEDGAAGLRSSVLLPPPPRRTDVAQRCHGATRPRHSGAAVALFPPPPIVPIFRGERASLVSCPEAEDAVVGWMAAAVGPRWERSQSEIKRLQTQRAPADLAVN